MFKKIIIFSALIFVIGISSCSMWDDVDKNTVFEIPVDDNINIVANGNPIQWFNIPIFLENDIAKNSISRLAINKVKIATNSTKTKLYYYVEINSTITMGISIFVLLLSNDYNCNGYLIAVEHGMAGNGNKYDICTNNQLTISMMTAASSGTANQLATSIEGVIDIPSQLNILNNTFLVTFYSTNNASLIPPFIPSNTITGNSTKARWAKLR